MSRPPQVLALACLLAAFACAKPETATDQAPAQQTPAATTRVIQGESRPGQNADGAPGRVGESVTGQPGAPGSANGGDGGDGGDAVGGSANGGAGGTAGGGTGGSATGP